MGYLTNLGIRKFKKLPSDPSGNERKIELKEILLRTAISTEQLKRVYFNSWFSDNVIVFYQITFTFKSIADLHDVNFKNLNVN